MASHPNLKSDIRDPFAFSLYSFLCILLCVFAKTQRLSHRSSHFTHIASSLFTLTRTDIQRERERSQMQDIFGSVRRSLVFRASPENEEHSLGVGGTLVDKISYCIRSSRVFSKPSPPSPPIPKDTAPPIRWRKGELIGCGAFGQVYVGMNLDSGELLAVKQVYSFLILPSYRFRSGFLFLALCFSVSLDYFGIDFVADSRLLRVFPCHYFTSCSLLFELVVVLVLIKA